MAREILFKAKRIDNGEWVEGYLLFDEFDEQYRIIIKLRYSTGTCIDTMYAPRVQTETICQYTGLTDKNSNRIWENDIVAIDGVDGVLKIEWEEDEETAMYILCGSEGLLYTFDNIYPEDCKVIGNIFDNPELLEGGE